MLTTIDAGRVRELTPWPLLIDALAVAFRNPCEMPRRQHYSIPVPGGIDGSLLLMPAWSIGGLIGVKIVQAYPGNSSIKKPAIHGIYMLASALDGEVCALLDAPELTARRTAAASALASGFLSRPDSKNHLIMGTGRLAFNMAAAHATVRPIERVTIWGRSRQKATAVANRVRRELGLEAAVVDDLPDALAAADIVTTVTTSHEPIVWGKFITPGTHIDLVGGFTPQMREADDDAIRMGRVYVDTRDTAILEAGDLSIPLKSGIITERAICSDLFGLCAGQDAGRQNDSEVTLFKSVGLALEDLAAASLAWQSLQRAEPSPHIAASE